jgi:hypothetical protein
MGAWSVRAIIVGAVIGCVTGGCADAQTTQRPPIGVYGSPPDAMIFYVAHGAAGACGQGCADWIAAEGTVQWDTHKRLIAILDRQPPGRRLPLVIHAWGSANLNVAASMGRILRDRGIDTTEGATEVDACKDKSEADCFALKRPGGPLDARINLSDSRCDVACVLMLAGGVHRSLPPGTRVILTGRAIHNRLAPNVSEEQREALTERFGEQFRLYLREMGVDTELLDIVDRNSETRRATELPPTEWTRLRIVTDAPP